MSELMRRIDLRFDHVAKQMKRYTVDDKGCWNWSGKVKKSHGRYGQMLIYLNHARPQKRTFAAHRVSYAYHNGVDPAGHLVRHTCDNPICINPDHLVLGSHIENMGDMVSRGRSTAGEKNPACRISESIVLDIVEQIKSGKSNTEIALTLPVSHAQVSMIRSGKSWRHVTEQIGYQPELYRRRAA